MASTSASAAIDPELPEESLEVIEIAVTDALNEALLTHTSPADIIASIGQRLCRLAAVAANDATKTNAADATANAADDAPEGDEPPVPLPEEADGDVNQWSVSGWLSSLGLHAQIAAALRPPGSREHDQFQYTRGLERDDVVRLLRAAKLEGLAPTIWKHVAALKEQKAATGAALSAKFKEDAAYQLQFGGLRHYFGGLDALIGPPLMIDGSLEKAMEVEHCGKDDSQTPFTSSNQVDTCSRDEWEFVRAPDMNKNYAERRGFRETRLEWCRKPMTPEALRAEMDMQNKLLEEKDLPHIDFTEVLAARLYTGPMYEKYNAALRSFSGFPFLVGRFQKLCLGNYYPTTIHAINSCVIKLKNLMRVQPVWRGSAGASIPEQFLHADEFGVRGGVEFAFSSTSTDRAAAVHYSQGKCSTIFEMQMGMVDRGADVSMFSQYPFEKEILFPPLMGVEVLRTRVDGSTLVLESRLSVNQMALTLDQVVSKRRKLVADMCLQMKAELQTRMDSEAWAALIRVEPTAKSRATELLRLLLERIKNAEPQQFNSDDFFGDAIGEAVLAASIIKGWPTALHRVATVLELRGDAEVERLTALLSTPAVMLPGKKLGHDGAAAASALLSCSRALTALDVSGNELGSSCKVVAKALETNRTLKKLNVQGNAIGVESALTLAEALGTNPSLSQLLVANNGLDDRASKALLRAIEAKPQLAGCAAATELTIEAELKSLQAEWDGVDLTFAPYKNRGPIALDKDASNKLITQLEEAQAGLDAMLASQMALGGVLTEPLTAWNNKLLSVQQTIGRWLDIQTRWSYLETVFDAPEISLGMQEETRRFAAADRQWTLAMRRANEVRNAVAYCFLSTELRSLLPHLSEELEACQASLSAYFERKRDMQPRLYFVSNNDLLAILCSKPTKESTLKHHLSGIIHSVSALHYDETYPDLVVALGSSEGQRVEFSTPLKAEGAPEYFITKVLEAMKEAVGVAIKSALTWQGSYEQMVLHANTQAAYLATLVIWTTVCEVALADGSATAMHAARESNHTRLATLVRLNLKPDAELLEYGKWTRKKVETMIIIEVAQRDAFNDINDIEGGSGGAEGFEWQKRHRAYWLAEEGVPQVRCLDVALDYGNEYLGAKERLVFTPLTDRCYLTLAHAVALHQGGAPSGPAGTGKTETVKDWSATLARNVYVINCSDQMDYLTFAAIAKGIAKSGAFCCYDEFNRVDMEVLAVSAMQFKCIFDALREGRERFVFTDGTECRLDHHAGFFITMNPGYAGRSELPSGLKALFRGVSMLVPDREIIMKVKLTGSGFMESDVLAKKFSVFYQLCEQQLSKQPQYDFGLRSILSVLRIMGSFRRNSPDTPETEQLLSALTSINKSRLAQQDVPLFVAMLGDIFVGVPNKKTPETIEPHLKRAAEDANLQHPPQWVLKATQLLDMYRVRHSVLVLGPAGSGKTKLAETLLAALSACPEQSAAGPMLGKPHRQVRMNPKAITAKQMFGWLDMGSKEWCDGILSCLWRKINKDKKNFTWLTLDGPIDAAWVENLNTVMDDNQVLTLASNERITMLRPNVTLHFEVDSLMMVSPATVSRVGIVCLDPAGDEGWRTVLDSWLAARDDPIRALLAPLCDRYVPPLLELVAACEKLLSTPQVSLVLSLLALLEGLLPSGELSAPHAERLVLFAAAWAFSGPLVATEHAKVGGLLQKLGGAALPASGTVFSNLVDEGGGWRACRHGAAASIDDSITPWAADTVFVPTTESFVLCELMRVSMHAKRPLLLLGPAGVSKTATASHYLTTLAPEAWYGRTITFTRSMTAESLHHRLVSSVEKKAGNQYGAPGGRKLVFLADDVSLAPVQTYGDQPPLEVLRQLIEHSFLLSLEMPGDQMVFNELRVLATMLPPGGGKNDVPERLKRHFMVASVATPTAEQVAAIFSPALRTHFHVGSAAAAGAAAAAAVPREVSAAAEKLVAMTCDVWEEVAAKVAEARRLQPLLKFHYSCNLRELSRIFGGIRSCPASAVGSADVLYGLWRHECERVLGDRLVDDDDRAWLDEALHRILAKHAGSDTATDLRRRPLAFAHWGGGAAGVGRGGDADGATTSDGAPGGTAYVPVPHRSLRDGIEKLATGYLSRHKLHALKHTDLVITDDVIAHFGRILRILRTPRSAAMLLGVRAGKSMLVRLAAHVAGAHCLEATSGYTAAKMLEDIRPLYRDAGMGEQVVFLFPENVLSGASSGTADFLEHLNTFLAAGELPGLFSQEDRVNVVQQFAQTLNTLRTSQDPEDLWVRFLDAVRSNLHIVLCYPHHSDACRAHTSQYPALLSSCDIDFFAPWAQPGLVAVASRLLEKTWVSGAGTEADGAPPPSPPAASDRTSYSNRTATAAESLAELFAAIHLWAEAAQAEFLVTARRNAYVSPLSFLGMLRTFARLHDEKRSTLAALLKARVTGLATLREADGDVAKMKLELEKHKRSLIALEKASAAETERAAAQAQYNGCELRLNAATKLLAGLQDEAVRWRREQAALITEIKQLSGDATLAAAFLTYAGPLTQPFRARLHAHVSKEAAARGVALTPGLDAVRFLVGCAAGEVVEDTADVNGWLSDALPSDERSIANGAIVAKAQRWPLMIDPQGHAQGWVRKQQQHNRLLTLTVQDLEGTSYELQMAITHGRPVLLTVEENLPSMLDALLAKQVQRKGETLIVKLGEREVQYSENFTLYAASPLANPHFAPGLYAQLAVVDFSVSLAAVEQQLLAHLLHQEHAPLADARYAMQRQARERRKALDVLEGELLERLATDSGALLEQSTWMRMRKRGGVLAVARMASRSAKLAEQQPKLFDVMWEAEVRSEANAATPEDERLLARRKRQPDGSPALSLAVLVVSTDKAAAELAELKEELVSAEAKLNDARVLYAEPAARGALLYALVQETESLDRMYAKSWQWFLKLFDTGVAEAGGAGGVGAEKDHVAALVDTITRVVTRAVQRGMWARHRLLWSLLLAIQVQVRAGAIDDAATRLLLGGSGLMGFGSSAKPEPKPAALDWLSDGAWLRVLVLAHAVPEPFATLPQALSGSVGGGSAAWRQWVELETPEEAPPPKPVEAPTTWQRLLLVHSLRDDRTLSAARAFVAEALGDWAKEAAPSTPFLFEIIEESDQSTPIVLVQGDGMTVDVVRKVAMNERKKLWSVAVGQGEPNRICKKRLKECQASGDWLLIENCHHALSLLREIASEFEARARATSDRGVFRLFLGTVSHPQFPITLLHRALTLTLEPAIGVKQQLVEQYAWIKELTKVEPNLFRPEPRWRAAIFTLALLHSVANIRRTFRPRGFAKHHAFTHSSWFASAMFVRNGLFGPGDVSASEPPGKLDWAGVQQMVGGIFYGGSINDDWDQRIFITMCKQWLTPRLLEPGFEFAPGFVLPPAHLSLEETQAHVEALPNQTSFALLGLTEDADDVANGAQAAQLLTETAAVRRSLLRLWIGETGRSKLTRGATAASGAALGGGGGGGGGGAQEPHEIAALVLQKLPADPPSPADPYQSSTNPLDICLRQEVERLRRALGVMRADLAAVELASRTSAEMSAAQQKVSDALVADTTPPQWRRLVDRHEGQLGHASHATGDSLAQSLDIVAQSASFFGGWMRVGRPRSFSLLAFRNPQALLAAVRQEACRAHAADGWALESVVGTTRLLTAAEELAPLGSGGAAEGSIRLHGLVLDGAAWDARANKLIDAPARTRYSALPTLLYSGELAGQRGSDASSRGDARHYVCPCYRSEARMGGDIFAALLPTSDTVERWILRGVALLASAPA